MTTYTPPVRQAVTESGRALLAAAVSIDHDWSLPASGHDKLMDVLGGMDADDLETAALLAYHLQQAIGCLLIRSDMEKRTKEER